MIIDTHVHIYNPFRPEGAPWPDPKNDLLYRPTLPVHLKAQAVPEGVVGAVVVEASESREVNTVHRSRVALMLGNLRWVNARSTVVF